MKSDPLKTLDRMLARLDRQSRRPPWRFSAAPLVLAASLVVGEQLLVRFVPKVWETFLPGGLRSAPELVGWPGLVWRLAVACHSYEPFVFAGIGAVSLVALGPCGRSRVCALLTRLAALGVIVLDAGVVLITLWVSYRITAEASGIPGL